MADNEVLIERADGWASVILNRPERKNAITGPLSQQAAEAISSLGADESVAAIVLRGAEGAFCSGIDLTELQAQPPHPWVAEMFSLTRAMHLALFHCPCPVITAVERYGINAGTALAMAGDLVVVGERTFLQIGEIQQGSGIPMNAAWIRLKAGEGVLSRLAFVGDRVTGPELFRLGLATHLVEDDAIVSTAETLARQHAGFPTGASRRIKADIRAQNPIDPEAWFPTHTSAALLTAKQVR